MQGRQVPLTTIETAAATLARALEYEAIWLRENRPALHEIASDLESAAMNVKYAPGRIRERRKARGAKQR